MVCVCDVAGVLLRQQACVIYCAAGVVDSAPTFKQQSCQRSNLSQTETFLESPHSNRRVQHSYSKVGLRPQE